jgi:hypothetical protein
MKAVTGLMLAVLAAMIMGAGKPEVGKQAGQDGVSFKDNVVPIIKQHCLPCHAEDNFNPSELSLESYASLMQGGKHGSPVVPGKSSESILMQKLGPKAPFGDPMPLAKKKPDSTVVQKRLSAKELAAIRAWIDQGAKDN